MKQLFFPQLLVALLTITLSGCAPGLTSTYKLEPVSGEVAMIDGRPVTKAEENGVSLVASFEREDLDFVALDIEVKNHTDHSVTVDPHDFQFTALGTAQDTLSDPANPDLVFRRSAADPAYELSHVDQKRKQETARLKRAKIFNTVLMVAAIASDVSSAGNSRTYREYANNRATHYLAYQGIAVKRAIDHTTFANRMQRYDYEEYRWRELALKATTLAAGESIRGLIYLPKIHKAAYLAMTYTVPEQASLPILFKQDLVQQTKKRR